MKKRVSLLGTSIMMILLISTVNLAQANCLNSCGSINDGKCNGTTVTCEKETDQNVANCNRFDSSTEDGNCPPGIG